MQRLIGVGVVIATTLLFVVEYTPQTTVKSDNADTYSVLYVVDGDSFVVRSDNGTSGVRLIGVDAPETRGLNQGECFSREARAYLRSLIMGKRVKLIQDLTQNPKDTYDRILAYVYLPEGGMVNKDLLRRGLVREYTHLTPYRYQEDFRQIESEARSAKRGLWDVCI